MPRLEQDTSPKGLPYGAEKAQKDFMSATGGTEAAFEPPPAGEIPQPPVATPELDIEGLGNLSEFLFAGSERPNEDIHTAPAPMGQPLDPVPLAPPADYVRMLRDPTVSDTTKAMIEMALRMRMIVAPPAVEQAGGPEPPLLI